MLFVRYCAKLFTCIFPLMFITHLYGTTRHTNLQVKESRCSEAQTHKLDLCQKCIQPSLLISGIIHFEEDTSWNMIKQSTTKTLLFSFCSCSPEEHQKPVFSREKMDIFKQSSNEHLSKPVEKGSFVLQPALVLSMRISLFYAGA